MKIINYSILVKGKVQGVWFRKYTKDKAIEIGVKGYVKNELDKTVFISAEGTEEKLNEFITWLYEGSPLSQVNEVIYDNCIDNQGFTKFEIKKDDEFD